MNLRSINCEHVWTVSGSFDRCERCGFLGREHYAAIVESVVDTALLLTVGLKETVDRERLYGSFVPPNEGWYVCQRFHPKSLVLSWLGQDKIRLGVGVALRTGRLVTDRGGASGRKRVFVVQSPNELRARKLLNEWKEFGAMRGSVKG